MLALPRARQLLAMAKFLSAAGVTTGLAACLLMASTGGWRAIVGNDARRRHRPAFRASCLLILTGLVLLLGGWWLRS